MERYNEITLDKKRHRSSYFVTSLFRYFVKSEGFTLAELIVSVAITGILMLGISVFFSSTFQGLFRAQTQTVNTEKQYVINEIIRDKFTTLEKVLYIPPAATEILFKNKNTKNQLPFSYIGVANNDGKKYLAFKDLMIFNKVYHDSTGDYFADSGSGKIRKATDGTEAQPSLYDSPDNRFKNFISFEKIGSTYYIVFPDKNTVMKCACGTTFCNFNDCNDLPDLPQSLSPAQLLLPTDIVKDNLEEYLFVSDSGNGRVIKYKIADQTYSILASPLEYPTGLAYYEAGSGAGKKRWLFVAETLNNKIRKINVDTGATYTVIGDGDDEKCKSTAKFCKLNMPTGIFAYDDGNKQELYIADSGNNRILKVKDPGAPESLSFEFSLDENYVLDRIAFTNSSWGGNGKYVETDSNLIGKSSNFSNKVFKNSDRLTTFCNTKCPCSDKLFYVNEESATILKSGNIIVINNNVFTINGPPTPSECRELPENPSLTKWKIEGNGNANISDGQTVFFSNPKVVKVKIIDIPDGDFMEGGFQTFTIKTYDLMKGGLVETDYYPLRVGDGVLGTDEDTAEVLVDSIKYADISFPTGVTNSYFANSGAVSGNTKVVEMVPSAPKNLMPIDTNAFKIFDYVSDFTLADGAMIAPLKFTKYNNNELLELIINAVVDENKIQTYTLNAYIPK